MLVEGFTGSPHKIGHLRSILSRLGEDSYIVRQNASVNPPEDPNVLKAIHQVQAKYKFTMATLGDKIISGSRDVSLWWSDVLVKIGIQGGPYEIILDKDRTQAAFSLSEHIQGHFADLADDYPGHPCIVKIEAANALLRVDYSRVIMPKQSAWINLEPETVRTLGFSTDLASSYVRFHNERLGELVRERRRIESNRGQNSSQLSVKHVPDPWNCAGGIDWGFMIDFLQQEGLGVGVNIATFSGDRRDIFSLISDLTAGCSLEMMRQALTNISYNNHASRNPKEPQIIRIPPKNYGVFYAPNSVLEM